MNKIIEKLKVYKFKPGMIGQIGIIGKNGTLAEPAFSCKDEVMSRYAYLISDTQSLDLKSPEFAYWTAAKTVERNAEKFQKMINRLEQKIGLKNRTVCFVPDTGKSEKTACFIVKAHTYWVRHPIHLSSLLVILSQTRNMRMSEGFKAFARRMIETGKTRDAKYFRIANKTGTLNNLMTGKLPGHSLRNSKAVKENWIGYKYELGFATYKPVVKDYKKVAFMVE